MNRDTTPCKNCEDRAPACHSKCDKYIEWRKVYDEKKEKADKEKRAHLLLQAEHYDAVDKQRKKWKWQKKK